MDGGNASSSHSDNLSEDQHIQAHSPGQGHKKKLAIINLESATSHKNAPGDERISSISEHHSDTNEHTGNDSPPSQSLDSATSSIAKSPLSKKGNPLSNSRQLIYKSTGLHKFQEFLAAAPRRSL
mmetsp:Transcript_33882/g.52216  ORF Transcript_33882/g.52216 Transcript_33882/m.52216 type:complete len:125 (+) Transcript_33882:1139-1513(+)